jgi:hypothetical protein
MVAESTEKTGGACTPAAPFLPARRLTTGLLAVAMAVYALLVAQQLTDRYHFPHNFHDDIDSPVLAIELAPDAKALEAVLGTDKPVSADPATNPGIAVVALRANTFEDFFFILLYASFLWQFAALFAISADGTDKSHRRTIAGLAFLIAMLDCAENVGILRALNVPRLSDFTAQAICWPSRCKWGLFAIALLLTGRILARSISPIYSLSTRRLFALAYGTSGIFMLIGLTIPHVIELATQMFALLVAINIVGLLGPYVEDRLLRPRIPVYVDDFCNSKAQKQTDVAVYPETSLGG